MWRIIVTGNGTIETGTIQKSIFENWMIAKSGMAIASMTFCDIWLRKKTTYNAEKNNVSISDFLR